MKEKKKYPKQFLNICEGRSLLQDTIVRNLPFADEFIIVTNESYKYSVIKAKEIAKNGAIANIVRDLSVDDVDDHAGIYIYIYGWYI